MANADLQKIVEILLKIEANQAQQETDKLNKSLSNVGSSATKFGVSAGAAFAAVQVAVKMAAKALEAIGNQIKDFVAQAVKMENAGRRLGLAFGNLETGVKAYRELSLLAIDTGNNIDEVVSSANKLTLALRKSPEEMKPFVKGMINIAALSGKSMNEVSQYLSQMWIKGAEGSREFARSGLLSFLGFQEGVKYSVNETRQIITQTFADTTNIVGQADNIMSSGWEGMVNTLKSTWQLFVQDIMSSGLFEFLSGGLRVIINYITELRKNTADWAYLTTYVSQFIVGSLKSIALGFAWIIDVVRQLNLIWQGLKLTFATIVEAYSTGFRWLTLVMSGFEVGLLKFSKLVAKVVGGIKVIFSNVVAAITNMFIKLVQQIRSVAEELDEIAGFWGVSEGTELGTALYNIEQGLADVAYESTQTARKQEENSKRVVASLETEIEARNKEIVKIQDTKSAAELYWKSVREEASKAILDHIEAETAVQKVNTAFSLVSRAIQEARKVQQGFNKDLESVVSSTNDLTEALQNLPKNIFKIWDFPPDLSTDINNMVGLLTSVADITIVSDEEIAALEAIMKNTKLKREDFERIVKAQKEYNNLLWTEIIYRSTLRVLPESAKAQLELKQQQSLLGEWNKNWDQAFAEGLDSQREFWGIHRAIQNKILQEEIENLQAAIIDETSNLEKRAELLLQLADKLRQKFRTQAEAAIKEWQAVKEQWENQPTIEEKGFFGSVDFFGANPDAEQLAIEAAIRVAEAQRDARVAILQNERDQELISDEEFQKRRVELEAKAEAEISALHKKSLDLWLSRTKQTTSMLQDAFANMYEATGQKIKAFFYLQKAAAIAETIISTYEGAQKAYTSMAGIPYVGPALGVAMAAIAVAGGLSRIAIISSQNLAKGGEVQGYSPTPSADNIPANLTAGEFVQPVSSVRYYGPAVMEAIRRQVVPREMFGQYALQAKRGYTRFASGGLATPKMDEAKQKQEVNIVNITTQDELNAWAQTADYENAIMNVVSRKSRNIKAILNE